MNAREKFNPHRFHKNLPPKSNLLQATIREFGERGHQFNPDRSEVAADIKSL